MMARLFLFLVWLAAAGCAGGRSGLGENEILSQGPVVKKAPGGAPPETFPRGLTREEAERSLDLARQAFLREEYDAALRTIHTALEQGAPEPVAAELRSLQFETKRRAVARTVLTARALPVRDVVAMGEPARVELFLRNVSPGEVRVRRASSGSSDSVFFLSVTRRDYDVYGNVREETRREFVPLGEDLSLPAGGTWSAIHDFATPEPATRHRGFTVLRVSGVLRTAAVEAGELDVFSGLPVEAAEVRAFPPGFEPMADDPLGSLRKAWGLGAAEHLLIAAALVPAERVPEAVDALVSFLRERETPATVTVMAALRFLTGQSFAGRPEGWIEWWEEERHGRD